jgi:hypothetical protein
MIFPVLQNYQGILISIQAEMVLPRTKNVSYFRRLSGNSGVLAEFSSRETLAD